MPSPYDICPISRKQIDSAYPLAKLALPSIGIEEWRDLCRASDGADEIALASNAKGYAQGLSISSVLEQGDRRILDVSSFVIVSAADEPGVEADLVQYLKARAKALNCNSVQIHLADGIEHSVGRNRSAGKAGPGILTIAL